MEYWPGEPPSALITHLIAEGARAIAQRNEVEKEAHHARALALAGKHADAYPPGYLEELRSEWPR